MGAFANFFLISKTDFEQFRKMAHLVDHNAAKAASQNNSVIMFTQKGDGAPENVSIIGPNGVQALSPEAIKRLDLKAIDDRYDKLWKFLHAHGKEPYEYKWSGYDLEDLLGLLKETKDIDLTQNTVEDPHDPEFYWHIFDQKIKAKYLNSLEPAKFTKEEITTAYIHAGERYEEAAIKHNATHMSKEELKEFIAMCQSARATARKELPERVRAMMDGINILHKYLQLIDERSIVILNIG